MRLLFWRRSPSARAVDERLQLAAAEQEELKLRTEEVLEGWARVAEERLREHR